MFEEEEEAMLFFSPYKAITKILITIFFPFFFFFFFLLNEAMLQPQTFLQIIEVINYIGFHLSSPLILLFYLLITTHRINHL